MSTPHLGPESVDFEHILQVLSTAPDPPVVTLRWLLMEDRSPFELPVAAAHRKRPIAPFSEYGLSLAASTG